MKLSGTKRIETERLILRRFTMGDAEAMYANWASDPEVTEFLTWPPHRSAEKAVMFFTEREETASRSISSETSVL